MVLIVVRETDIINRSMDVTDHVPPTIITVIQVKERNVGIFQTEIAYIVVHSLVD